MPQSVASELLPAEVLKPTATVHIANDFSFLERKMINAIMADYQMRDLATGEFDLPLKQLCHDINFNSRNREPLKQALETLVTTAVKWNVFEQDKVVEWGVCTFLSSAKIVRGGNLKYRVNDQISAWIANPTLFAKFYLLIQTRFSKKHSLILYEFFVDELSRRRALKLVMDPIKIKDLRGLLGIAKDQYEEFKIFNRAVLKPSIEEINTSTDVRVNYDLKRRSRKAAAIVFSLQRNTSYQLPLPLNLPTVEQLQPVTKVKKRIPKPKLDAEQEALLATLLSHGVVKKRAMSIIDTFALDYIRAKVNLVEIEIANGKKIRNRGGYLADAIVEDYQFESTEANDNRATQQDKRPQAENIIWRQRMEKLRPEWEQFRNERAKKAFFALKLKDQNAHKEKYQNEGGIRGAKETLFLQDGGWDNPIIMHEFIEKYLVKTLLKAPGELLLEEYAKAKLSA